MAGRHPLYRPYCYGGFSRNQGDFGPADKDVAVVEAESSEAQGAPDRAVQASGVMMGVLRYCDCLD